MMYAADVGRGRMGRVPVLADAGDFQTGSFFIPYSVIIGRFYFEKIGSCGQIGVSGLILGAYIVPVFVKSFQFIGVFVFIGNAIA